VRWVADITSLGNGINGQTQLVGYNNNADLNGWLYDAGSTGDVLYFATTGYTETFANAVNNNGTVAGYYTDQGYPAYFYLFNSGGFWDLTNYPGYGAQCDCTGITGINDAGQIVGYYVDSSSTYHGWIGYPQQQ
jgi:hypothetical protein